MVIELATGMVLGLGIGYGLDVLFGTLPIFLVIFSLLGFAAGIKTMLGTARELGEKAAATGREGRRELTMATEEHAGGLADPPDGSVRRQAAVRRRPDPLVHPHQRHPLDGASPSLRWSRFWSCRTRRRAIVPSRGQSVAELFYGFIHKMVEDVAGHEGLKFFPYIMTLFMFVFLSNFLGLIPMSFTTTSHIAVTATLALMVFLTVTLVGFYPQGHRLPGDVLGHRRPRWSLRPILAVIEVISYFVRPLSATPSVLAAT